MNKKAFIPLQTIDSQSKHTKFVTGLTLLEILVSCMLLAFVLTALANVFVIGKRYTLHSRSRIQVAELGKFYLEPLQGQVRQDEWANNCLGKNIGCAGIFTARTIDNIDYTPTWTINDVADTSLRRVILTINWNEPPT